LSYSYYTRVAVLEQVGYREWTESLGSDREWLIQETQARLYAELQEVAARHNAFPLAARYDYMIILAPNVGEEAHAEILEVARSLSKVAVRMASSCAETPLEAEARALKLLKETDVGGLTYTSCPGSEISVIAHLDLNNITGETISRGVIRTYHRILDLTGRLSRVAERRGGVVQYLGGDNVLAILPTINYISLVEELLQEDNLKAGVGIAKTAREALKLAARALHDIRVDRSKKLTVYISP